MTLVAVPEPPPDDGANWALQPPHDPGAEQVVLGAMLLSPPIIAKVAEVLAAEDFYRPAHQVIYSALLALYQRGEPTDPIAVNHALTQDGSAVKVGGPAYLHTLTDAVPTPANGPYYARIVADYAKRRIVMVTGNRLVQLGQAHADIDTAELLDAARQQVNAVSSSWPEPVPLDVVQSDGGLPEFPLEALPRWLGLYAAAVSDATQTPPDPAGCLGLAALSTAASGRIWVHTGHWSEPACVYAVVAMPPASRKSAVFGAMFAPLFAGELQLVEQTRPTIIRARINKRIADAHAEELAAKATSERDPRSIAEAEEAAEAAAVLRVPAQPKLWADDITPETLARRLAEQEGRMSLLAPEGGFFGTLAGRYSGMPNLDTFLKAHAGEQVRVERQGRDPDYVAQSTLTIGIALQPEVLKEVFATPGGRGRGLLARILYSIPADTVGFRDSEPAAIPEELKREYHRHLSTLLFTLWSLENPHTITLSAGARGRVTELLKEVEPQLRPNGRFAQIRDWAGKYVGAVVRIAALLHLGQHPNGDWVEPISAETFDKARAIGEYYAAHALAVFDAMSVDADVAKARQVLDWLSRKRITRFTEREAFSGLPRSTFPKVAELRSSLEILESYGWLRSEPRQKSSQKGGRPPSPTYQVHPKLSGPYRQAPPE